MSESTDDSPPIKIRIPRLAGADEAEAADVAAEVGEASLGVAAEEEMLKTTSIFTLDEEEVVDQEELPTPFNTPLAPEPPPELSEPNLLFAAAEPLAFPPAVEKMRMAVICGHPRDGSLCEGLAEAYADAALAAGHPVKLLRLHELDFDPNERGQPLEPSLEAVQQEILDADHLVFVFPVWWGSVPALLKGFLDRVFRPDFAFREREEGGWDGLLGGRTADLLVTMDTPQWVFRTVLGAPAVRAVRDATLGFCGIKRARTILMGPVRGSTPATRSRWLDEAAQSGREAETWHRTGWRPTPRAWTDIARLHFQIFPALAVVLGALTATKLTAAPLHWGSLLLALLGVAMAQFISVLTNEWHDLPTDSRNKHHGPFTGGSRVLVEGRMSIPRLLRGRNLALGVLLATMAALCFAGPAQGGPLALLLGTALGLGLGYSAPPLRLASRGLGEITVALTHSVIVLLIGYASQAGSMTNLIPWALSAPLFFAVLPAILLAGLPDLEADVAVGKDTLAVRLGRRTLTKVALAMTVAATLFHLALIPFSGWWLTLPLVLHAGWLSRGILDYLARPHSGRIDGLMFRALSFMLWFVLAPLLG